MAGETKITLSDKELSMVRDDDWILTRHIITGKIDQLLSQNIPLIKEMLLNQTIGLSPEVRQSIPKIYKGENYKGLPYLILDYPRFFDGKDIFAVRTMFWWANFFSITLHLSGKYKMMMINKIISNKDSLDDGFYLCVNEDQWQHHFEQDNYIPYKSISPGEREKNLLQYEFIKLALNFNLSSWNGMEKLLIKGYEKVAGLIH